MYNNPFIDYPKKELKKTSNRIGLTLLIVFGAELILGIVMSVVFYVIKFNTVKGHLLYYTFLAIITLLALLLPFIILVITTDPTGQKYPIPFKRNSFSNILISVIICMGITYVAQIISAIVQTTTKLTPPELPHNTALISIAAEIFTVAIIPGIVEEIVYRGIILSMFRRFGDWFAVFISALLFGLSHFNIVQFIFTFIIGLAFGFITVKLNSLLPSMIAHTLNNLCATLLSLNLLSAINYSLIMLSSVFVSIGLIISISIKDKSTFKLSKASVYPVSFWKKLSVTCCSPAMIIFLIFALLTFLGEVLMTCFKTIFS